MHKRSGPGSRNDNNNSRGFKRKDNDDNSFSKKEGRSGKSFDKKGDKPFPKKDGERSFRSREDGDRKPFPKKDGERSFRSREDGDKKPFPKKDGERSFRSREDGDRKPFPKKDGERSFRSREDGDKKPFPKKDGERSFRSREDGDKKPFPKKDGERSFRSREDGDRKPFPKKDGERSFRSREDGDRKPFPKKDGDKRFIKEGDKPFFKRKTAEGKPEKPVKDIYEPLEISEEKKNNKKAPVINKAPGRGVKKETNEPISSRSDNKPYYKEEDEDQKPARKRIAKQSAADILLSEDDKQEQLEQERNDIKAAKVVARKKKFEAMKDDDDEEAEDDEEKVAEEGAMPLNKYLAHCGVCSRREAATEVKAGKVRVNDTIETNPAYKVAESDVVYYNDKKVKLQKGMVYILLNKPKDFITTNDDPQGRKTVMDLVANSGEERLFPVGRLDRNTTGLLLLTNDGDLTQKLAHPSFKVKKIYQVTTDKPVTKADFDKILNGVELEDGKAPVDALAYLEKKNELGIEIHIGRNRIVRRIFESLGYEVEKLDRVMYGSLTKKNLPRGKWRYLNEREIVLLKHFKS